MSWVFEGAPYLRETLEATCDQSRREVIVRKSSAAGWTEVFSVSMVEIVQARQRAKKLMMFGPTPAPLADAIKMANTNSI